MKTTGAVAARRRSVSSADQGTSERLADERGGRASGVDAVIGHAREPAAVLPAHRLHRVDELPPLLCGERREVGVERLDLVLAAVLRRKRGEVQPAGGAP